MQSYWIRVGLEPSDWYPYKRLKRAHRDTEMKVI